MLDQSGDIQSIDQNSYATTFIGSPFSPGIPLRADQRIFGRDDAFRFIAGELLRFSSVNLVSKRRMGKTSLLNHLIDNQARYFKQPSDQSPLTLVRVDFQDNISKAEQFYGKTLRRLMETLIIQSSIPTQSPSIWLERIRERTEATAHEFEQALEDLKKAGRGQPRPVLLIDEFERVFEPHLKDSFPFPDFFDGLRAQITADRVAMVLFTRKKLRKYFKQQSLTSTFPSYFHPFILHELDNEAADELLLQPSDHQLNLEQARKSRAWAGLHPCRLQCAGAAWYQAKSENKSERWAKERYMEIVEQSCFVNPTDLPITSLNGLIHRLKRPRYWFPLLVTVGLGVLAWTGNLTWISRLISWCKDNSLIVVALCLATLIFFGKVNGAQVLKLLLDRLLGDEKEKKQP